MSIQKKTVLLFLFLICAFTFILYNLFFTLSDYKAANERARIAYRQLITLESLNTSLISQTKTLAGYLLDVERREDVTGYTADIRDHYAAWDKLIHEEMAFVSRYYEEDLEEEKEEQESYLEISRLIGDFHRAVETIIRLKEQAYNPEALALYRRAVSEGGQFESLLKDSLNSLIEEELEEVSEVFSETTERHGRLFLTSLIILTATAVILIFVYLSIIRIIIRPLKMLELAVIRYKPGEQPEPSNLYSKDEIGSLAQGLSEMMEKIHADTVKLDYVAVRVDEILHVVDQITQGCFDVFCPVFPEPDNFDRLSVGINGMIKDLARSIKDLQVQHDWLENILSNTGDGIITTDSRSRITYINTMAGELTGRLRDEALGAEIKGVVNLLSADGRQPVEFPIGDLFNGRTIHPDPYEYSIMVSGNGEDVPVETEWTAMKDSQDNLLGALFVFRDISSLLMKKKEVENLQVQMVQKEKLSSIGFLAAGIAHEINNPIGYIQSNLRTLRKYTVRLEEEVKALQEASGVSGERAAGGKDLSFILEEIESILDDNDDGISKISSIVDGMKSFSRGGDERFVEFNLNSIVKNTLAITTNEIKYTARTVLELHDVPLIRCIPNQINQVLLNLVLNAAHAIEEARTTENTPFQGVIGISTYEEGDFVICKVSDNGRGIEESILPKIFDPFFTTKDPDKGSGLGLHISYNIIKKHQGVLLAQNLSGGGAQFLMKFRKPKGQFKSAV